MRIAIGEIERFAAAAKTDPAALMINHVLDVGEEDGFEIFEHP